MFSNCEGMPKLNVHLSRGHFVWPFPKKMYLILGSVFSLKNLLNSEMNFSEIMKLRFENYHNYYTC